MADRIDLTVRVHVVEMDLVLWRVHRRFDAVDAAILEQRQCTEFAFSRLEAKMDARFEEMDARFDRLERKLDRFIDGQPGRT